MKIFFSAGDVSGDNNTAPVIAELKQRFPNVKLWGLGGHEMQKAGFNSGFEFSKFNKMGYWEVIKNLPFFMSAQKKFIAKMREEKPDVLVCVDFSGFNKNLVVEANKLGIKVLWFIAPMIWVWKREKWLSFFEHNPATIACIFPFEPKYWEPRVKTAEFVGNPLVENFDKSLLEEKKPINPNEKFTLALVPGSRAQEVEKMLPFMVDCIKELKKTYPKMEIVVSKSSLPWAWYEGALSKFNAKWAQVPRVLVSGIEVRFEQDFNKVLAKADFALATSGTASLQLGLAGVKHIVLYKTSPLTFAIFKAIIKKKPLMSLTNIMLEKELMPEFLQEQMTVENVLSAIRKIIENPSEQEKMANELNRLKDLLGEKKTSVELVNLIEKLVK